MLRRLNYTGRKRLKRRDCAIELVRDPDSGLTFTARLSLAGYGLPPEARVFVDAYRQMTLTRFDFGRVDRLEPPADRTLREFGSGEAIKFRIRIVEGATPEYRPMPRVLAALDHITPRVTDERPEDRESLLPVDWGTFDDQVWKLDFDETTEPLLRVSRSLVPDRDVLVRSRAFMVLALPEAFRQILTRILLIDRYAGTEDTEDWRAAWLAFATRLPVGPPPVAAEATELEDWIEDATAAFCRRAGIGERSRQWIEEGVLD